MASMKTGRIKSAIAALSLTIYASAAQTAPGGLLLIGDSWAEQQFSDQSHSMVFAALGYPQVQVFGAATVESGSTAAEWATPGRLAIISQTLTDPAIETVQLTVGGNDFLDAWNAELDPATQAALFAAIRADVETIVEFILGARPDVEILLSFYDYPNFVDTLGGIIGALVCAPLWNSMAQPTPLELNTAAVALEQSMLDLADHPRVFHVSHFGQMQSLFGFPGMGIAPGDLQPPGDPALPSPPAAMRFNGTDCFHLRAEGYDQLVINQFEGYFETRFTAHAGANSAPQIGGVAAGQVVDDTDSVAPFGSVTVTDVDGDNVSVTINLDVGAKGEFTPASLTASGFSDDGGGIYSRPADTPLNTQAAIRQLVYKPAEDRVPAGSTETTIFTIDIDDGTDFSIDSTTTVVATSIDQAPVAFDDNGNVLEDALDTTITVLLNDMDSDGGPREITSVAQPANGTAINNSSDVAYRPDEDYCFDGIKPDTFDYTLNGGSTATVSMLVVCVNDQPTFTAVDPAAVLEDSGSQSIANWAAFDAGVPNELQDVLGYTISNVAVPGLFAAGPAVDNAGTLTFTPAADAFGSSTFDVVVQDDGGIANGGIDTSNRQTFTITVEPVNDAPTFANAGDVTGLEDGDYAEAWASSISPGPASESGQSVTFVTSVTSNPGLFATAPAIDASGTLTFTPAADAFGSSTFDVVVQDDGGIANGGIDTSNRQTFTIIVEPVNDAPTFANAGDVTGLEDGDYAEAWASSISPGPASESGQSVTFVTSVTSNPGLFATAPAVDASGALTFIPAADTTGSATIEIFAMDDGEDTNGGTDRSVPATFIINVIAAADLIIDKTSGSFFVPAGGRVSYTIVVSNPGPSDVTHATVTDIPSTRLGNVSWTCAADPGAACVPNGNIEINELVNLPEGTSVTFQLDAELTDALNDPITNTASVTAPVGVLELVPATNTDSDTDLVGLFADGMESGEP